MIQWLLWDDIWLKKGEKNYCALAKASITQPERPVSEPKANFDH